MPQRLLLFLSLLVSVTMPLSSQILIPEGLNIDIPVGPKPWSSLDFNRSDDQFQFAIVTDRTGGRRPGIFMKGIQKLNLLQPEFVMTVGDLIDGYTENVSELDRQWDEFDGFVDSLQMPFFYLPGNHDITNAVMDSIWRARLGATYYHFAYKDVLFLCLNSEDQFQGAGRGTISEVQYKYIEKILAEHEDVRWTLVFMHQPLWLQDEPGNWPDVEKLLEDREHTVFVGHVHHYVRYMRNNGRYYTLATTGGGSAMRGPNMGEFDHVTWVTMTDDGPIMANLDVDGIYAEDVVTEASYDHIHKIMDSYPLRINPLLVEDAIFDEGMLQVEIRNSEDVPLSVQLTPKFNFDFTLELPQDTISVAPNSVEVMQWKLRSRRGPRNLADLSAQALAAELTYGIDGASTTIPLGYYLLPEQRRVLSKVSEAPKVDGILEEWETLPYSFGAEEATNLSVEWGITYDEQNVYVAAKVIDDEVQLAKEELVWRQDNIRVIINADPLSTSMMRRGEDWYENSYILTISPENDQVSSSTFYQDRYTVKPEYKCIQTTNGYTLEMALPLTYIRDRQSDNWQQIRVNVQVQDQAQGQGNRTFYSWKPLWRDSDNVVGSGLFFRE